MTEEKIITRSENGLIVLTNRKVRYTSESFGKANITSIMLNEISTIEVSYKSNVPSLLLGILFILAGLALGAQNQGDALIGFLFLGAVCIIVYLLTRRHVVSIISRGSRSINFKSSGMRREAIMKFINQVEQAKFNYENKEVK